jgi:hypothetical protein
VMKSSRINQNYLMKSNERNKLSTDARNDTTTVSIPHPKNQSIRHLMAAVHWHS